MQEARRKALVTHPYAKLETRQPRLGHDGNDTAERVGRAERHDLPGKSADRFFEYARGNQLAIVLNGFRQSNRQRSYRCLRILSFPLPGFVQPLFDNVEHQALQVLTFGELQLNRVIGSL